MPIFAMIAIMVVVSVVTSAVMMSMMDGIDQDDIGSELPDAGATKSLDICYGRSRVRATRVLTDISSGSTNHTSEGEYQAVVAALGSGPFNSLQQLYINGDPVLREGFATAASSGTIGKQDIREDYRDHIQIQFNMGQDKFFYSMINSMIPEWDASCIGNNIASVAIKIMRDPWKGKIQSTPSIEAVVEGRLIRDIRYDNPVKAYRSIAGTPGTNPALALYDYVTDSDGANIPADQIDEYSIIQYANFCDQQELFINGVVDQQQNIIENIKKLADVFNGQFIKVQGLYKVIGSWADVSSETITKDDIISEVELNYGSSKAAFNRLEVEYQRPAQGYQKDIVIYPTLSDDELIARDGAIHTKKIETGFITTKAHLDKVASSFYEQMRRARGLKFTANHKGFCLETGDVIQVVYEDELLKINEKYRVLKITRYLSGDKQGTADLELVEYNEQNYKTIYKPNEAPIKPYTPRVINPPTALRFSVAEVHDVATGLLSWNAAACCDFLEYQVEYKLSSQSESEWRAYAQVKTQECYIQNMHQASYDFRVYTRTKFMETSAFALLYKVDVKDDTLFPTVTGLKLITSNEDQTVTDSADFSLVFDSMDDVKIKADQQFNPNATQFNTVKSLKRGYQVTVFADSKQVYQAVVLEPKFTYTYQMNKQYGLSRNISFEVRVLGKGGALSRQPGVLKCVNKQHQQPTGLEARGSIYGITASWDIGDELDYKATRVYLSKQKGFKPTNAELRQDDRGTNFMWQDAERSTWYFRLAHYDMFGLDNLVFSPEIELKPSNVQDDMTDMLNGLAKDLRSELNTQDQKQLKAVQDLDKETTVINQKLDKEVKDRSAAVNTVTEQLNTETKNRAAQLTAVQAEMKKANLDQTTTFNASVKELTTSIAELDKTTATKITTVESSTTTKIDLLDKKHLDLYNKQQADLVAKHNEQQQAITTASNALAESIKTTSASLSKDLKAQAELSSKAEADINGKLSSQFVMKATAGGVVTGIGVLSDAGTKTSIIMLQAANTIITTNGTDKYAPFEVNDKGVLINRAMIQNLDAGNITAGSITADCMAANSITARNIVAGSITTDKLAAEKGWINNAMIGNIIQSDNYQAGAAGKPPVRGWCIDKAGTLYAKDFIASGRIEGAQLSGCMVEATNFILSNGSNKILVPTEADGYNGWRWLAFDGRELSGSVSFSREQAVNSAYSNTGGIKSFNYSAENVYVEAGVTMVANHERMKKRYLTPSFKANGVLRGSAQPNKPHLDQPDLYNASSATVHFWICDQNGNQINNGYAGFNFGFPGGYSEWGPNRPPSTSHLPTYLVKEEGHLRFEIRMTWDSGVREIESGSNGGDHQSHTSYLQYYCINSIDAVVTPKTAWFDYSGNHAGARMKVQVDLNAGRFCILNASFNAVN
ncbi:phage tail protein [Aeromonas sp.]|uniref:phage tail tip fiber protein n=1 Tax=Aeromonas sp. TaxID=647 RepID=UPI00258D3680|nr:phage tail protein [Aeromonas sp.]MCX7128039.1 phage tail protein [Aeromonas sp.]